MGLIVYLAVFVLLTIAANFAFRIYWPGRDALSWAGGVLYTLSMLVLSLVVPRVYGFFLRHGWVADLRDWRDRVQFGVSNDWLQMTPRGWDIDFARVQIARDRTRGYFRSCVTLVGIHLHMAVLVDRQEHELFKKAAMAEREEMLSQMPAPVRDAMRQMIADMPMDANFKAGVVAVPRSLDNIDVADDDDDDTDKGGTGGVH